MRSRKSLTDKFRQKWNELFWSQVDSRDLGLFRLLYCLCIFLASWNRFEQWAYFIEDGSLAVRWGWLSQKTVLDMTVWRWISFIWFGSLLLAILGYSTRLALLCALTSLFILIAPLSPTPYDTSIIFVTLSILLFAPGIQVYGLDALKKPVPSQSPSWPKQLILIAISMGYLSQAFNKLFFMGGLAWVNGVTLQVWLRRYYFMYGTLFAEVASSHRWLAQALSLYTILFELFFFMIVLRPGWRTFFVPFALLFHVCVYLAMRVAFIFFFCPSYLVLVNAAKAESLFRLLFRRQGGRISHE